MRSVLCYEGWFPSIITSSRLNKQLESIPCSSSTLTVDGRRPAPLNEQRFECREVNDDSGHVLLRPCK